MDDGFAAASCKKNIGDKPQRQFVRVDCLISVNEKKMEPSIKNVKKQSKNSTYRCKPSIDRLDLWINIS